jgi:hypothetical protein
VIIPSNRLSSPAHPQCSVHATPPPSLIPPFPTLLIEAEGKEKSNDHLRIPDSSTSGERRMTSGKGTESRRQTSSQSFRGGGSNCKTKGGRVTSVAGDDEAMTASLRGGGGRRWAIRQPEDCAGWVASAGG